MQHSILPRSANGSAYSSPSATKNQRSSRARHMVADEGRIIYKSKLMHSLMAMIDRVASSNAKALILGESGTGKELIAQEIHKRSTRSEKPFVAINCGALNEELLESELFGHEKGAFTNAYTKKIGLAEAANGGTLFLDEIGDMSAGVQAKLLRFLQEGVIFRVGGNTPIKVDIRLISATNRDLGKAVLKGEFREDLYHRINTIILQSPALRRRPEDIEPLVEYFLSKSSTYHHSLLEKPGRRISTEALAELCRYDWPGNVRELQNCCERLQVLAKGQTIQVSDLTDQVLKTGRGKAVMEDYDPKVTLGAIEKKYIITSLKHFDGNKTKTAKALGITIKTLYNKLHQYDEFKNYATQK